MKILSLFNLYAVILMLLLFYIKHKSKGFWRITMQFLKVAKITKKQPLKVYKKYTQYINNNSNNSNNNKLFIIIYSELLLWLLLVIF